MPTIEKAVQHTSVPFPRGAVTFGQTPPAPASEKTAPVEASKPIEAQSTEANTATEQAVPDYKQTEASQFAELIRQQKKVREQQRALELQKQEIEQSRQKSGAVDFNADEFKQNPIEFAKKFGITPQQLAQMLIADQDPNKQMYSNIEAKLDTVTKTFEEKLELQKKEFEEKAQAQAVQQLTKDVKMLVEQNSEFETIKALGRQDTVVKWILARLNQDGTLLSAEDAAKEVEAHLMDEVVGSAGKLLSISKIKEKLNPPAAETGAETNNSRQAQSTNQLKTLTHATTSAPTRLTEKDRLERARLAFYGQLK